MIGRLAVGKCGRTVLIERESMVLNSIVVRCCDGTIVSIASRPLHCHRIFHCYRRLSGEPAYRYRCGAALWQLKSCREEGMAFTKHDHQA